jgi:hypothetical protein
VDLVLKLNVSLNFAMSCRRSVRFHRQHHQQQSNGSHCACVGFSIATRGVIVPPSFEIGNLREPRVERVEIDCDLANANRQRR